MAEPKVTAVERIYDRLVVADAAATQVAPHRVSRAWVMAEFMFRALVALGLAVGLALGFWIGGAVVQAFGLSRGVGIAIGVTFGVTFWMVLLIWVIVRRMRVLVARGEAPL